MSQPASFSAFALRFRALREAPGINPFAPETLALWALQGAEQLTPTLDAFRVGAAGYVLSFVPAAERGPFTAAVAWPSNNDDSAVRRAAAMLMEHDRDLVTGDVHAAMAAAQVATSREAAATALRRFAGAAPAPALAALGIEIRGPADGGGLQAPCPMRNAVPHGGRDAAIFASVGGELRVTCATCGYSADLFGLVARHRGMPESTPPAALRREVYRVAQAMRGR